MRTLLDRLYLGCGVLAAIFMAAIAALVLSQTIGRLLGIVVPSANELAGFCVAASTFLALAPTLQQGTHIRVSLLTTHVGPRVHRWLEAWSLAVAFVFSAYFAWWAVDLVRGSIRYGDVSPGLLAVPLWIPQLAMAGGLIVFAICLLDNLVRLLRGGRPAYEAHENASMAE